MVVPCLAKPRHLGYGIFLAQPHSRYQIPLAIFFNLPMRTSDQAFRKLGSSQLAVRIFDNCSADPTAVLIYRPLLFHDNGLHPRLTSTTAPFTFSHSIHSIRYHVPRARYESEDVDPAPLGRPLHFSFGGKTAPNRLFVFPPSWPPHSEVQKY